jgi:hypothetical protein
MDSDVKEGSYSDDRSVDSMDRSYPSDSGTNQGKAARPSLLEG